MAKTSKANGKSDAKNSNKMQDEMGGTLRDAFLDELKDSYDAEKQLVKALSKLAGAATSPELRAAFEGHFGETRVHVQRLEKVFELLGEKAQGKHCDGIAGIVKEGGSVMEEDYGDATMDACLIASGQRAEHYEIGAYGTLVVWAQELGLNDAADLLKQILAEEKAADKKLTSLAEGGINRSAVEGAAAPDDDELELPAKPNGRGKQAATR